MKKAIEFTDVLGNKIQLKTAINLFKQLKEEPCWIIESRKVFPQITNWDSCFSFQDRYFESEEKAFDAIKKYLEEYQDKSKRLGKDIVFTEVYL